jgi:hypothetical protein
MEGCAKKCILVTPLRPSGEYHTGLYQNKGSL